MSITFAEKLARIPHYEAGASSVDGAEREAASTINRYSDPGARAWRAALAGRFDFPAARIAVGNGSCEILLAAAEALLEPGSEIVYAWPSFSMYPHLAAITGTDEVQVPL